MDFEKHSDLKEIIVSDEYTRAVTLTRSIIANAQAAQQSLYEVCRGLKEMRDGKLYRELGYQNFEEYTENEVGISRFMAYKYTAVAEIENVESIQHFGVTKLALLAKLDEPTRQEVQQNVDVESATVRELKGEIAALHAEKARLESSEAALGQELDAAEEQLSKKDKQFKAAMESKQNEIDELRAGSKRRYETLITKIQKLQAELDEAKQKPDAVTVEDVSRIEELTQELADCREQLRQAQHQLAEKPMVQEAMPEADHLGEFRAYYAAVLDDLKRIFGFVQSHAHSTDMPLFLDKLSNIVSMSEAELEKLKGESSCP